MNDKTKKLVAQAKQFAQEKMAHPMEPTLFSAEVFQNKLIELVVEDFKNVVSENFHDCNTATKMVGILTKHFES
jgi:hypothetical protein